MTSNDLLRFCDSEVARYSRPWSRDGRTYACNNVVLIAVPALPDVRICPATGMHPALIVFTGGEGLLMPMRRKAT